MSWSSTWPDGAQSVKTNQATGGANTTYIETGMNLDHYWGDDGDNKGRHKQVQMTQTGTAAAPDNVVLATGMDGAFYTKAKSDTESLDNQDVQPFFIDNKAVAIPGTTQIMQLLGIRSMGVFAGRATNGACTIRYQHNLTSVTRTSTGHYTAVFPDLPTNNYLVFGEGVSPSDVATNKLIFGIEANNTLTNVKAKSFFKLITINSVGLSDPLQCWFVVFGG